MRAWLLLAAALVVSGLRSEAQLLLRAGESYTYEFSDLPFRGSCTRFCLLYPPYCVFRFNITPGSVAPDTALRWEMFFDSPAEAPFHSGVLTNIPYEHGETPWPGWDRQGAFRLTALSGALIVEQFTVGAQIDHTTYYDYFETNYVPAPRLVYRRLDQLRMRLSWTTNAVGYRLEHSFGLPAWSAAPNVVSTNGSDCIVDVVTGGRARFFRLGRP